MADWYADISLIAGSASYNATPTAAGTVPTKPEDGNGKGSGVAAMATLVITFTGVPNADETVTIAGVTFTAKASGATGNQFNAVTDAATCATNLKNAINASTTNAVQPSTEVNATAPLRNIVNATSSAGVVTVYSRHGSAAWNSVTENETLTNASITSQWSGGADGAWGYLFNPAAIAWPGSVSAGAYGAWVNTYLGQPAAGDVIHMRTKAGGSNLTLSTGSVTVNTRDIGSTTSVITYKADAGVKWSGDSGTLTIDRSTVNTNTVFNLKGGSLFLGYASGFVNEGAVPNFVFSVSAADTAGYVMQFGINAGATSAKQNIFETVYFKDAGNGTNVAQSSIAFGAQATGDLSKPPTFINCKIECLRSVAKLFALYTNAYQPNYLLVDCLFALGNYTYTGVFTAGSSYGLSLDLIRPKFTGGNGGAHSLLVPAAVSPGYSFRLVISDPVDMGQFGAISYPTGSFCHSRTPPTSVTMHGGVDYTHGQWITPSVNGREMLIDTPLRLIEAKSGFPTTGNSLYPDGTAFSLRFSVPYTGLATGLVTQMNPQRSMKMVATNTLGDVVDLTLTLHTLIDSSYGGSSYTPADNDWWIEVQYVSGGVVKQASTKGTGSSVASDTQSWSSTTYSPFGGSSRSYSKWKFPLNITDVDADTDIIMYLVCAKQPSLTNELCFYCPQFQVALT